MCVLCEIINSNSCFLLDANAPPRPPLPAEMGGSGMRGKAPQHDTTTDDESEEIFQNAPTPSQGPIMVCFSEKITSTCEIYEVV